MPQMSPLTWLNLYFLMILFLLLIMSILNSIKLNFKIIKSNNNFILIYYKWFW